MADRKKPVAAKTEETGLATVEQQAGAVAKVSKKRGGGKRVKPITVEQAQTEQLQGNGEQDALVQKGQLMGRATIEPIKHGFQQGQAEALSELSAMVGQSMEMVNNTLDSFLDANYSSYLMGSEDGEIN